MLKRAASLFLIFAAAALAIRHLAARFTRYEISGDSMAPTLLAGEFVVVDRHAYATDSPSVGDTVLAPDPREPGRMLVKRAAAAEADRAVALAGDNPAASTDSRHFGPVPVESILGRVRWRYWPPRRIGRVR